MIRKSLEKDFKKGILLVYSQYSFGIVKKCNAAAKLATAKCIVVATDDTIPEIDWDEKLIESADWNTEVVLNTMDGTEEFDKRTYMVKTVILSKKDITNLGMCCIQISSVSIVIIFILGYHIKMMLS